MAVSGFVLDCCKHHPLQITPSCLLGSSRASSQLAYDPGTKTKEKRKKKKERKQKQKIIISKLGSLGSNHQLRSIWNGTLLPDQGLSQLT